MTDDQSPPTETLLAESLNEAFPGTLGFGASFNRELDAWVIYTTPTCARIGQIDGYAPKKIELVLNALRATVNPSPETHVKPVDLPTLYCETTPEGGVIRLSKWPEGYVLWFHGEIVWRSWISEPQKVTVTLSVDTSEALASLSGIANSSPQQLFKVTGFRGNPLRVVLSNGNEAIISQKLIDSFASPSPFEKHPDDAAVDRFAAAMKAKLAKKREEGFSGWDDPEVCHIDFLVHLLAEQIHSRAALDTVDIGNFAMMIFNRGETPSHGR